MLQSDSGMSDFLTEARRYWCSGWSCNLNARAGAVAAPGALHCGTVRAPRIDLLNGPTPPHAGRTDRSPWPWGSSSSRASSAFRVRAAPAAPRPGLPLPVAARAVASQPLRSAEPELRAPLRPGGMKNSLLLHPNDSHIIYPLGATVVIRNVHDNKDQYFLQGAPPPPPHARRAARPSAAPQNVCHRAHPPSCKGHPSPPPPLPGAAALRRRRSRAPPAARRGSLGRVASPLCQATPTASRASR